MLNIKKIISKIKIKLKYKKDNLFNVKKFTLKSVLKFVCVKLYDKNSKKGISAIKAKKIKLSAIIFLL